MQTCIRRRQARKKLADLRVEARSASHLKEVSYKLENKVVELTQNLTFEREEKNNLRSQAAQLEAQIKTWTEKYAKLEKKAEDLQLALNKSSEVEHELAALRETHKGLQKEHQESKSKIEEQEKEIARLTAEITQLRQRPPPLTVPTPKADDAEVAELKNQIAALKAQLSQSLKNPPRRQASLNAYSRNLSPIRSPTGRQRGISPDSMVSPRGRSPTGANTASYRRNSIAKYSQEIIHAEPEQIRPMSLDHVDVLRDLDGVTNPEEAIHAILHDEQVLEVEILEGLIRSLKIPQPNPQNVPSHQEVVFPAHVIGLGVTQMWRFGYLAESERLIFTVMDTIQKHCLVLVRVESV